MSSTHSRVHAAARSEEEKSFFRAILADLADLDRQLIYADWLDDRGDERAAVVRDLVEAAREAAEPEFGYLVDRFGCELEDNESGSWFNLLGWPSRAKLADLAMRQPEFYTSEYCAAMLRSARPALRLTVGADSTPGDAVERSFALGRPPRFTTRAAGPAIDERTTLLRIDLEELKATLCESPVSLAGVLSLHYYASEFSLRRDGWAPAEQQSIGRRPLYPLAAHEILTFPRYDSPQVPPMSREQAAIGLQVSEWVTDPWQRGNFFGLGHTQYPFTPPEPAGGWLPLLQLEQQLSIGWNFNETLGVFLRAGSDPEATGDLDIRVLHGHPALS